MLRAARGLGRLLRARPRRQPGAGSPACCLRPLSTVGPGGDGGDDDGGGSIDDEFEDMSFDISATDEAPLQVDVAPSTDADITPALASEMVARMVAAATSHPAGASAPSRGVVRSVTPHTVTVLRASRIQTNEVFAPAADDADYPINRKVVAVVDVARLGLSPPAAEALRLLAGARYREGRVTVACDRFGSSAENQALAVGRVERLVRAAREACGEEVDAREMESWEEVTEEVERQLGEDGGQMQFLLTKKIKAEETVAVPVPPSLQGQ